MDISIIIVNWNVCDLLKKCLESVLCYTEGINYEIIVIDNASSDGSAEMVRKEFSQLKLIENKKNLGFATANNQGIRIAKGRYILLLNPDTELIENSLKIMVEKMDEHRDWRISGCKLLNPDKSLQSSVRRYPGVFDQSLILLKLHHLPLFKKLLNKYLMSDFDYEKEGKVNQVMGAFFMIRREVIDKIGSLDEKYLYWFEEVDYCHTAQKKGFQTFYTPSTSVIHHGGQSFRQLNWQKQLVWNESINRYFWKHKSKLAWFIIWLLQPFSLMVAFGLELFKIKK